MKTCCLINVVIGHIIFHSSVPKFDTVCFPRLYLNGFHQGLQEQWCCVPWVLSKLICETLSLFSFSPHCLEVPGEALRYMLHCGPLIYHLLSDIFYISCYWCLIYSPRALRPCSGSQCSYQNNLCPWSDYICWCQSCHIQSQHFSLLVAFLSKPPGSQSLHFFPRIYV